MESKEIAKKIVDAIIEGWNDWSRKFTSRVEAEKYWTDKIQSLSSNTKVSDEEIKSKHLIHTSEVLNDFLGRDKETLTMITSFVQENREDYAASVYDIVANKMRSKLSSESDAVEFKIWFDKEGYRKSEMDRNLYYKPSGKSVLLDYFTVEQAYNLFREGKWSGG